MALPPLDAGAVQLNHRLGVCLRLRFAPVGAPGTLAGVTALDGADAVPVPAALVAATEKVYEVPLVSPVTEAMLLPPPALAVNPPGDDVTV